jgi:triosephosphate isomerase
MAESTNRMPLVSGNWKMNLNHFEAIQFVQRLAFALKSDVYKSVEVSLHPPFTDIRSVQTLLEGDNIPMSLGAQHCFSETAGAYTGEVSPPMLAKLNVKYVIVGHSERRQLFSETDEEVNKRVRAIIASGMTPILCVGETSEQRDAGEATEVVFQQLDLDLKGVSPDAIGEFVIAYEPVWAIGTGQTPTPDDAQQMCNAIRERLREEWDDEANSVRIQYGGSVKPSNASELFAQADVDGFLVGGASIEVDDFARIVTAVAAQSVLA